MCKALAAAMGALSAAPAAPEEVTLAGAVSPDARLRWKLPADARIADVVLYRGPRTRWSGSGRSRSARSRSDGTVVTTDDWFFAVATADAQGNQFGPRRRPPR